VRWLQDRPQDMPQRDGRGVLPPRLGDLARAEAAAKVLREMRECRALLKTAQARGEERQADAQSLWRRVDPSSEPTLVRALHTALNADRCERLRSSHGEDALLHAASLGLCLMRVVWAFEG
jgi:hypothetical protein